MVGGFFMMYAVGALGGQSRGCKTSTSWPVFLSVFSERVHQSEKSETSACITSGSSIARNPGAPRSSDRTTTCPRRRRKIGAFSLTSIRTRPTRAIFFARLSVASMTTLRRRGIG